MNKWNGRVRCVRQGHNCFLERIFLYTWQTADSRTIRWTRSLPWPKRLLWDHTLSRVEFPGQRTSVCRTLYTTFDASLRPSRNRPILKSASHPEGSPPGIKWLARFYIKGFYANVQPPGWQLTMEKNLQRGFPVSRLGARCSANASKTRPKLSRTSFVSLLVR